MECKTKSIRIYDIGEAVGHVLNDYNKLNYLQETWTPSSNYSFPVNVEGKQTRRFRSEWLTQYNWLAYSEILCGGFCKMCVLFAPDGAGAGSQVSLCIDYFYVF